MKILMLLFTLNAHAGTTPAPSTKSCEFYRELQSQYQCTSSNYLSDAYKACQDYLREQPQHSEALQTFLPAIRYCLQDKLSKVRSTNFCDHLTDNVIAEHIQCYTDNHYCSLSLKDKAVLGEMTFFKLFQKPWGKTAAEVNWHCI